MKTTYSGLLKIIKNSPEQDLPQILRFIFSDKKNIGLFAYFFFPHMISSKSPAFHKEIYDFLFRKGNGALGAPRGTAKSTTVGIFYLCWCLVNRYKKYIVYMSQNHEKTTQFVDPIRNEFKYNQRLRYVYGDLTPRGMRDEDGKDRQDMIEINHVKVQAASFNKNIRGFKDKFNNRPDLIIGDDIDDDERVINPLLRKKDLEKLTKQIIPSLADGGQFKMIGTILHWDSLLVNRIRAYGGKIFKICQFNEEGKIIPESLLWPDYWNEERILAIKKDIGSVAFSSEFLNNPIDNEKVLIKKKWIMACCDEELSYEQPEKYDSIYMGVDFAFSDRVISDKSAYVALGTRHGQKHTIVEISTNKGKSITEQFNLLQKYYKYYNLVEVVMEENSIRSMTKELYIYNFPYYLIWTGNSDTAGKLTPEVEFEEKRHSVSKKQMIIRLGTQFENGNIRLPYKTEEDKKITNELISELTTFALQDGKLVEVGVHADIPIALAMAIERIAQGKEVILEFLNEDEEDETNERN